MEHFPCESHTERAGAIQFGKEKAPVRIRKKGTNSLMGSIVAGQEEIISNKKRGDFGYKKYVFL